MEVFNSKLNISIYLHHNNDKNIVEYLYGFLKIIWSEKVYEIVLTIGVVILSWGLDEDEQTSSVDWPSIDKKGSAEASVIISVT